MGLKGVTKPRYYSVPISREHARRVARVVHELGEREAVRRLGIGKPTLEAAVGYGAVRRETYDRLLSALERVEQELLAEVRAAAGLAEVGT